MSRVCTWVECTVEAKHVQNDRNGEPWADLCDAHDEELDAAITCMDAKRMLSSWVKASGGPKKMMETMTGRKQV